MKKKSLYIRYKGTYNEQIYDPELRLIYWTLTDRKILNAAVRLNRLWNILKTSQSANTVEAKHS